MPSRWDNITHNQLDKFQEKYYEIGTPGALWKEFSIKQKKDYIREGVLSAGKSNFYAKSTKEKINKDFRRLTGISKYKTDFKKGKGSLRHLGGDDKYKVKFKYTGDKPVFLRQRGVGEMPTTMYEIQGNPI